MKTARVPAAVPALVFGLLVVATFAAFFVAQRLKQSPGVLQFIGIDTRGPGSVFSPNGDGRRDRLHIALQLKDSDNVTLTIVDDDGDPVRTLVDDRPLEKGERLTGVAWDGTGDDGRPVPDGRYRLRIILRRQGRSILYPKSFLKDTTPPRPYVFAVGPSPQPGPEVWPNRDGKPVVARFPPALPNRPRALVYRTDPGHVREVHSEDLRPGQTSWRWDPTGQPPGTYVIAVQWRDQAGNVGTSVPLGRDRLPALDRPGWSRRGGVTVRYVGARGPVLPVPGGEEVTFRVHSAERYRWTIRRLGERRALKRGGPKRSSVVRTTAPERTGVYLFEARVPGHATRIPFAVQGEDSVAGAAEAPRGGLVVLPMMTWQGRNPVDDDGDGRPDLLDYNLPARLYRDMGGGGLPQGFAGGEAPVLMWLDRERRRYDITTDVALLAGEGRDLRAYKGVLIPGDARWLPAAVRRKLQAFVRRGGTLVSLGTDSLRRTVALDGDGRLVRPSRRASADFFGARIRDLVREPTGLSILRDDEDTLLFEGTGGAIPEVRAYEQTISLGPGKLLSNAVTENPPGRTVVVAARYGDGRVIRTGLPEFQRRLSGNDDPAISALMARMWTLLSR